MIDHWLRAEQELICAESRCHWVETCRDSQRRSENQLPHDAISALRRWGVLATQRVRVSVESYSATWKHVLGYNRGRTNDSSYDVTVAHTQYVHTHEKKIIVGKREGINVLKKWRHHYSNFMYWAQLVLVNITRGGNESLLLSLIHTRVLEYIHYEV